jgi:hypothetical protein
VNDVVVVISLNSGEELLAILHKKMKTKIKVEHPFIVKYTAGTKSLALYPLCPLSDETFFDLKMSDIRFLTTAAEHIADKFFQLIDKVDLESREEDYLDEDTIEKAAQLLGIIEDTPALQEEEDVDVGPSNYFVEGNKTKH